MAAFQEVRSGGRVVEGARLESEYTAKPYRGFESLPLRHVLIVEKRNSSRLMARDCASRIGSPRPGAGPFGPTATNLRRFLGTSVSRRSCSQCIDAITASDFIWALNGGMSVGHNQQE